MKMKMLNEHDYMFTRIAEFKELDAKYKALDAEIDAFTDLMRSREVGESTGGELEQQQNRIKSWNDMRANLRTEAYFILEKLCEKVFID